MLRLLLLLLLLLPASAEDFEGAFRAEGVEGCMAIWSQAKGWREYHPELTKKRFVPASTFKIPNSLIGLETGQLPMFLKWDGVDHGFKGHNQDLDLKTAFKVSAAWYYQEMARRVGLKTEKEWVMKLGYGNMELGQEVDQFWLEGPLQISPREQVEFLRRLYEGDLPVKESSRATVISLMDQGQGLHAKTGWARFSGMNYGWFVGWVERANQGPDFFALLILQPEPRPRDFFELRIRLAKKVLGL